MTTNTTTTDTMTDTQTVNAESGDPKPEQAEQFKLAFENLAAERNALAEDRVERINVDIPNTVNTVLGHLPQIRTLASEVKALPGFDASMFDKIESYAQALSFAQMLFNAASAPVEHVPELAATLATIRDRLVADASALATRGFLDASRLADLKGGPGYKNIAYDVGTLVAMMRSAWSKIAGKTAVSEDELKHAQVQAEGLLLAIAAREQQEIDVTAAGEQRQRAFTLLSKAYDEARRAATFLRWGQDIEQIVPSFYNGRGGKKRIEKPQVAAPSGTPEVGSGNGNGNGTGNGTAQAQAPAVPSPSAGLPGASPYAAG